MAALASPADEPLNHGAFLFSTEIMDSITEQEAKGIYTAERLKSQEPDKYDACIVLLSRDMSQRQIATTLHIHHRTVAAVWLANPKPIDALRSKLSEKLSLAGMLQVERLIEDPGAVPFNVAGLVASQLLEKAQLFAGGPTAIVETGPRKLTPDEFNRMIAALPTANSPTMGFSEGISPTNGEPATGATDSQSAGSQKQSGYATHSDTLCDAEPDRDDLGGGGGALQAGGLGSQIHPET